MEFQGGPNNQNNTDEVEQRWKMHSSWFQNVLLQSKSNQNKNSHVDKCKRTRSPEINPELCGLLIFYKGTKNIQWKRNTLVNKQF